MTPEKLATGTAELSRKRCADVSVKILASSATEALYERKTANCAPMRDEYTIGKVIWGPSSITSISYAKTTMMNDTERTKWTDIVGRARLVNECQK
jgi:hypothetical protein